MQIRDQHVVITGAASGIGAALARRFAAEGARALALADLDAAGARKLAEELGPRASAHAVDVADEAQIRALVADTAGRSGPIDLFCSNAGIGTGGGVEVPDEAWNRMWSIHVLAHIYAARAVLPSMIERGRGYLLQTASAAGLLSQIGSAPYAVTKHAAVALAEWLAIEHGAQGIRVSVLCPQAVRTEMTRNVPGGGVAALDGMMDADTVADHVVRGLVEERFLILPHPEVSQYMQRKVSDRDRWIAGMQRLRERFRDRPAM
jgi:NAD(P)-dependent dehydrogenase (short-subunit alcohol dehydrogenase family)